MKLFAWLLILSGMAYGGAKAYLHNEVAEAMDMAVLMAGPFATIEYDGVASTMSGELTIEGVRIKPANFNHSLYIDRIGIDTPSFLSLIEMSDFVNLRRSSIPEYFGFIVDGLTLPVNADYYQEIYKFSLEAQGYDATDDAAAVCTGRYGFSPETLADLGYREQVFSMSLIARNGDGQYRFEINTGIEDMWDADATVTMAGNMMSELSLGSAYRPKLRELEIEYNDRSLQSRVEKLCGRMGLSAEQTFRAQLESFEFMGESNGVVFDEYMLEPYKEFLKGKSTFLITARPNEPITMSQIDLYNPADVPALLNLEAQAL